MNGAGSIALHVLTQSDQLAGISFRLGTRPLSTEAAAGHLQALILDTGRPNFRLHHAFARNVLAQEAKGEGRHCLENFESRYATLLGSMTPNQPTRRPRRNAFAQVKLVYLISFLIAHIKR